MGPAPRVESPLTAADSARPERVRRVRALASRLHVIGHGQSESAGVIVRIANCMTRNPVTVTPHDLLARAKALMDSGHFRRLPVMEQGKLVGMLTERDIRNHWGYLERTRVDAAMTPDPVTITPRISAEDAARLMLQHKIGGLPVVEEGELVGIVSTSDILKAFLNVVQAAQEIMSG